MARDPMSRRWDRKKKKGLLDGLFRKNVDPDLLDEEEQILAETPPVAPIEAEDQPGRNDPCPCGSGQKYKKCCWGLSEKEIARKRKKR